MEMSVAPRVALHAAASSSKLTRPLRATASSSNKLRGRGLGLSCSLERVSAIRCRTRSAIMKKEEEAAAAATGLTVVMKFGGSSLASAERMKEVADLILSFPDENPVVVLAAMGKTTSNLLLAGEKAVSCGATKACEIPQLSVIKELHLKTIDELGLDRSIVSGLLDQLEQLLKGIAMMKELTLRTRDYLVSFGECMSTRIFAAYVNKLGKKARQYDAFDIGFITTDDFTNADILEVTYPTVAKRLNGDWMDDPAIPIVTGFLGKGCKSCAVTTLGRGGSDLTAMTIGKSLGLREIQVWKDVDGVLTCDPNIYAKAIPVPYMTFDEAAELAYFGAQVLLPQTMQLPSEHGNLQAPGTIVGNPTPLVLGREYSACVAARPGIASLRKKSYVGQYQRQSGSIDIRLPSEDAVLKIINYEDLKILRELGSGAFGTVHLAELRGVGNVAVKFLNSNCYASGSPTQEREEFLHEARALSKLRHPNVLQFLGVVVDGPGGTLAIVTEFLVDGSLWKVSRCKDKCLHDEHKKLKIATDIASAMKYVHSENFIHFDLKGGNLLMDLTDENCPICIVADFGLSKIKKNALISGGMRGTLQWMAPEILDGFKVSEKVDVYSYGIVLWEIEAEKIPYWGMDRDAIKDGVMSGRLRPLVPAHCGPEMKRLMESCWAHDPEQRPTFTEILTQLEVMSVTAKYTKTMEN